jgi:tRNA G18 (ribose-2'-O)-methylase SpoU
VDAVRPRTVDRRSDTFVVEGARTIQVALEGGWPLESVLLSTAFIRSHPDLVGAAVAAGAPVYTAGQEVLDRIAGFHVHRGALALARRPPARPLEAAVEGARLILFVEAINDHENVGALFRNAAALGVEAVVLDRGTADPLYRRAVRVSMGQVLRIPFARTGGAGDLLVLRDRGFRLIALDPGGQLDLADLDVPTGGRVAVMVGSEGQGLSPAAREVADVGVRIPMARGVDSLNVATAAAVALYRVAAAMGLGGGPGGPGGPA